MPSKVLEILETEIGLRLGKIYISPYPFSDGCPHPHSRINCGLSARRKTASCDCDCTDCRCCRCRSASLGQLARFCKRIFSDSSLVVLLVLLVLLEERRGVLLALLVALHVHLVQDAFRRLHEGGKLGLRDVPVLVLVGVTQHLLQLRRQLRVALLLFANLLLEGAPNLRLEQLAVLVGVQFLVHLVEVLRRHGFLRLRVRLIRVVNLHLGESTKRQQHPASTHRNSYRSMKVTRTLVLEP